jgi:hypothetical protein
MGWMYSSRPGVVAVVKWDGVGVPSVNLVFPTLLNHSVKSAGFLPKDLNYVKSAGQTRLRIN